MTHPKEDLKSRVRSAFSTCTPPHEDELVEDDWDASRIRADFAPYLRATLPPAIVEAHANSLPALKPRAFLYFLRDYLLYGLDHIDSAVSEYLIFRLHELDWDEAYGRDRLSMFSKTQRDTVADCCEWFLDNSPDREMYIRKLLREAVVKWRA